MLKHQLLDEMFAMGGNHDIDKINTMKDKLSHYLEVNGSDVQIEDGFRVLEAHAIEFQGNNSEISREISKPIFDRLSNTAEWDFYDIRLLTAVVGYSYASEQTYKLAEIALEELEDYSHEERYIFIKLAIRMNTVHRLLRAKYFDSDNLIPSNELATRFSNYFDAAMAICEEGEFPIHKAVLKIRKGLFYQDKSLSNRGFRQLIKTGEKEIYRMMLESAQEYDFLAGMGISKNQFNEVVGANIKKKRRALGFTAKDLGKILGITSSYIQSAERGENSFSSFDIYKLSNILDVTVDYFYQGIEDESYAPSYRKARLKELGTFVDELSDGQLNNLIQTAKKLPEEKISAS